MVKGHAMRALSMMILWAAPVLAASPAADDRATKDDYTLDASTTTTTLKKGGAGEFHLVITPKNGKKVHPDAPLEISIVDNPHVKPGKQKLGRGDLVEKGAPAPHVRTSLQATKSGTTNLSVNVSFFLCTDAWCQRMNDRVEVPITVEE